MKRLVISALAIAAMASCSKADSEMDIINENELRITSSITTRASGDDWATEDKIGIYMSKTDGDFGELGANRLYTTTAGNGVFSSTDPLFYPTSGTVDLLAYYPYDADTSFDPTKYSVDVSSEKQKDLPKIDLMKATESELDKDDKSVELTFNHKLSNIVIEIENSTGFTKDDLKKVTVTLSGTKALASYDLTKVDSEAITFALATQPADIIIPTTNDGTKAEAIVIPQTLSGATLKFTFEGDDDNVYSANILTAAYTIGNTYSYTAKIQKTSVTLSAASITPWNEGNGEGESLTAEKVVYDMEYNNGIFEINTAEGLKAFADLVNGVEGNTANVSWGDGTIKKFSETRQKSIYGKLMEDINLNTICGAGIGDEGADVDWTPISNITGAYYAEYAYKGTFDGNGKVIEGLYIDDSGSSLKALFGYVVGAKIKNLEVSGEVTGNQYVAGIVGYATTFTLISGCCNNVEVSSPSGDCGGIVGSLNSSSTVIACYNQGKVTGTGSNGSIYFGGIVGQESSASNVIACYNTAGVYNNGGSSSNYFSGIVGYISGGTIKDCFWVDVQDDAASCGWGGYSDTGATKCDDIDGIYDNVDTLNEAIAMWNINNSGNKVEVQFATCESPKSLIFDYEAATLDGLSYNEEEGYFGIENAQQLSTFAGLVNRGYTTINGKLIDSFSLKSICGDGNNDSKNANWTPIGNASTCQYSGKFDGDGKTISDIYIDNASADDYYYQGLFGRVKGATIENLTLTGYVKGKVNTGGIVGYITGNESVRTTIRSCTNQATVSGANNLCGGVVGEASYADITSCSNSGQITGSQSYIGGVVGGMSNSTLTSCTNSAQVINNGNYSNGGIGGIVGYAISSPTIIDCSNSGAVSGICAYMGGVVGQLNKSNLIACSNSANVTNNSQISSYGKQVGGVVGRAYHNDSTDPYTIVGCYNSGAVSGYDDIGGVVGYISGSEGGGYDIIACYNSNTVSATKSGTIYVGGVVGSVESNGTVTPSSNYWYDASSTDQAVNGIGKIKSAASDTGAEKLDNITALNGKVTALNNAIYTWNDSNSTACPYKYEGGNSSDVDIPTLVSGVPTYTEPN